LFGDKPDIDIKPSSLEPSCEKLSELLSGVESNTNSFFTKNLCEEFPKEKYVSRIQLHINTEPSPGEKPCDELLIIKQQDQNIKQLHRKETKKSTS